MKFFFYVAETAGFCWGVKRAIQGAEGKERKAGEPIYVLGDLVHNQDAVEDLERHDVHVIQNMEEARGKTLLITAHGRSPEDIERARTISPDVVDMTCPIVKDLHRSVLFLVREGRKIVLIGKKQKPLHPEVAGVYGLLGGDITIIDSHCDMHELSFPEGTPIGIVAQTTVNESRVYELVGLITKRFRNAKFIPTVCDDISRKQAELRSKALAFDIVIVIGDLKSSNATHLAEIAEGELGKKTYFVLNGARLAEIEEETAKSGKSIIFSGARVFVIAGASTPESSISGVSQKLTEWGGVQMK